MRMQVDELPESVEALLRRPHRRALGPPTGHCSAGPRCSACASRGRARGRRARASDPTCCCRLGGVGPARRVRRARPDVAGAFRFRHALFRDAAYDGLSFRRRRELHARVGEVLERLPGAASGRTCSHSTSRARASTRARGAGRSQRAARRRRSTRTWTRRRSSAARSTPRDGCRSCPGRGRGRVGSELGDVSRAGRPATRTPTTRTAVLVAWPSRRSGRSRA